MSTLSIDLKTLLCAGVGLPTRQIPTRQLNDLRRTQVSGALVVLAPIAVASQVFGTAMLITLLIDGTASTSAFRLWVAAFLAMVVSDGLIIARAARWSETGVGFRRLCTEFSAVLIVNGLTWGSAPLLITQDQSDLHALTLAVLTGTSLFGLLWTVAVPNLSIIHLTSTSGLFVISKLLSGQTADMVWAAWVVGYNVLLMVAVMGGFVFFVRSSAQKELTEELMSDFEYYAKDWRWETDEEHRLTYASERMHDSELFKDESLLGQPLMSLLRRDTLGFDTLLGELEAHGDFTDLAVQFTSGEDDHCWSMSGRHLLSSKGEFKGYTGVCSDITSTMRIRELANDRARYDTIAELSSSLAHDFNNNLLTIQGFLDLVRIDPSNAERIERLLDAAQSGVSKAAELVNQMLAFSRRDTLLPRLLDLQQELTDIAAEASAICGDRITFDLDNTSPCTIFVDRNQLSRSLLNIFKNSIDAMPSTGTITVTTTASGEESGDALRVVIEVADTGCGIPEDILSLVREPFFTTKRSQNGSGLGLSMTTGFVEQCGGQLSISSSEEGTTVRIELPASPQQPMPTATVEAVGRLPNFDGVEILLVEDNLSYAVVAADSLRDLGARVVTAATVSEATSALATAGPFDLLIADYMLPDGTGTDVARTQAASHPHVPIIFVTGFVEHFYAINFEGPPSAVLKKPFRVEELMEAASQMLSHQTAAAGQD